MKALLFLLSLCAALLGIDSPARAASDKLPPMNADLSRTSVSGISSGGFMAAQIATAYSSEIMGVGIIAAGPFYCAGSNDSPEFLTNAMAFCMKPVTASVGPSGLEAFREAEQLAADGKIDPVEGLRRQRVYIFSGLKDMTVKTVVVDQTAAFYQAARVPASQVKYERHPDAAHAIVTANPDDLPCGAEQPPYINNCGFFQSHVLLRHIYPDRQAAPSAGALQGRLLKFDQGEFLIGKRSSMDKDAWVYLPASCQRQRCAVHVAFHGCRQGRSEIGDLFYDDTGYNEFADANGIIVLYPQVHAADLPPNPRGCWDFWGYSDRSAFYTRAAPQMQAVMAMVQRLGEARPGQP